MTNDADICIYTSMDVRVKIKATIKNLNLITKIGECFCARFGYFYI